MAVSGVLNRIAVAKKLRSRYTGGAINLQSSVRKLCQGRGASGNMLNLSLQAGDLFPCLARTWPQVEHLTAQGTGYRPVYTTKNNRPMSKRLGSEMGGSVACCLLIRKQAKTESLTVSGL